MAGQSSLTTSRLAALSLSPSRIAQLGVKQDARGSITSEDENAGSTRERKRTGKDGEGEVIEAELEGRKGKQEGLTVRPDLSRRSSTLESLSDEEDDDGGVAEGYGVEQEEGKTERENGEERKAYDLAGIPIIRTDPPPDSSPSPSNTSPPRPVIIVAPTAHAGSSRDRSPPPSYEHAILPSALEQSSSPPTSNGQSKRPMSATARGKQRDDGNAVGHGHDSAREDERPARRGGDVMLELLPNSDTDEEDVFSRGQTQASPSTASNTVREPAHEVPHSPPKRSPGTPAIFLPALGQPSSARRKHRPILAKSSRTRSSYTGPVEMIDRSGEGWADSLVDDDYESDNLTSSTGYDVSSSHESLPRRPNLVSSTSSFIRSLPSPSSGAFTQDVRILGWKIVGGRTGRMSSRGGTGQAGEVETGDEHAHVEDPQKPRMGAYVGRSHQVLRPMLY